MRVRSCSSTCSCVSAVWRSLCSLKMANRRLSKSEASSLARVGRPERMAASPSSMPSTFSLSLLCSLLAARSTLTSHCNAASRCRGWRVSLRRRSSGAVPSPRAILHSSARWAGCTCGPAAAQEGCWEVQRAEGPEEEAAAGAVVWAPLRPACIARQLVGQWRRRNSPIAAVTLLRISKMPASASFNRSNTMVPSSACDCWPASRAVWACASTHCFSASLAAATVAFVVASQASVESPSHDHGRPSQTASLVTSASCVDSALMASLRESILALVSFMLLSVVSSISPFFFSSSLSMAVLFWPWVSGQYSSDSSRAVWTCMARHASHAAVPVSIFSSCSITSVLRYAAMMPFSPIL
mmetsp:Transcript_692/g.2083  ORF Transcript_692/g.2083 Transcript_692/m.2083 type:complete len:355 (+) Transcript_692:1833-2897(+)